MITILKVLRRRPYLGRVSLIVGIIAFISIAIGSLMNLTTGLPTASASNIDETSTVAGENTDVSVASFMDSQGILSSSKPNHSSPSLITPTQSNDSLTRLNHESESVDFAGVIEQSRNAIQIPNGGRPPFISRPSHQASFQESRLEFTPVGASGSDATLAIRLAAVTLGSQPLLTESLATMASIDGNVVAYQHHPNFLEEYIARDNGIEQRWQIEQLPEADGDLVITVEVETTLTIARVEGGQGYVFRDIDPTSGQMAEVAYYGRAIAIDADGDIVPADLSFETKKQQSIFTASSAAVPTTYTLIMTIPGEWLAEAAFPLLVDPLISSAVQLDQGGSEADQAEPAVAYNTIDDEYLVVWQDNRSGTNDIFGRLVADDGTLFGNDFTVNSSMGNESTPDLAYNADDGTYLAVWRSDSDSIQGQIISRTGELAGNIFTLSGPLTSTRNYPAVAYSTVAGAWLVIWQEWNTGAARYDIIARAVEGNGSLETAFTVYSDDNDAILPDLVANESGGFLAVWEQTTSSNSDIYARRTISTAVDGGMIVLTSTTAAQVAPTVTYNPDEDEYLVAWQDLAGAKDTIWARQVTGVTATNPFVGSAFQVNPGTFNALAPAVTYFSPSVAVSGTYLIAWELPISGETGRITAQRVLTDGTKSGSVLDLASSSLNGSANVALGYGPAITATVAAWTSELGGHSDVAAIWIPAEGSAGVEFFVHPQPDDQERPEVTYNSDDEEYLVVWHDYRAGEADPNLFGQRVSITGTLLGDNITITTAPYRQLYPKVAYGDGVYLVAWTHYPGLSDTDFDAYAGIISATGTVITNSLVISTGTTPNSQAQPTDIIYNGNYQKFLVLYQDRTVVQFNIWGRHVDNAANLSGPIQITSQDNRAEIDAVGAYNPDNDHYLVVWEEGSDLYGRRLTGAGVVSTTETIIIAENGFSEEKPDVVYLNGQTGYVVVWRVSSGGSRGVYGRVVASNGTTPTAAYQISSGIHTDKLSRIALDGKGGAMIIWHYRVDSETNDLYGRRLGSDGQPLGDGLSAPFTILEMADTRQTYPALAGNGVGQYLLAWQDDRNGNWDIYGQLFQHLTADFSANPTSGSAPLTVVFTDTSVPSGVVDSFHWEFGDGHIATTQHPTHTFTETGIFTVTLTVTDTDTGETDTTQLLINTIGDPSLTADFTASPLVGTAPLTVSFANQSISATSYLWHFGDGTTSTTISPTHTYTEVGVYTVILTASNSIGSETLTRINYIVVNPDPFEDETVFISPTLSTVDVGDIFTVAVDIYNIATAVSAYQFDLTYDDSSLQLEAVQGGDFLSTPGHDTICPLWTTPDIDTIRFACTGAGADVGNNGSGQLAILTFTALDAGTSSLVLSNLQLPDTSVPPTAVNAQLSHGLVIINAPMANVPFLLDETKENQNGTGQNGLAYGLFADTNASLYVSLLIVALFVVASIHLQRRGQLRHIWRLFVTVAMVLQIITIEPRSIQAASVQHQEDSNSASQPLLAPNRLLPPITPNQQTTQGCYDADLDCDLDVDEADVSFSFPHWDCDDQTPCYDPDADIDDNDIVDAFDLAWIANDYDVEPPEITITSPIEGAVVSGITLTVSGLVTDVHAISAVTVNEVAATVIDNSYSAQITVTAESFVINVMAEDEVGQVGLMSRVVLVDSSGPMIKIEEPPNQQTVYTTQPSVTVTYEDFLSSIK